MFSLTIIHPWGYRQNIIDTPIQNDPRSGQALKRMTQSYAENGDVKLGPDETEEELAVEAQILVLASGNFGLVYGTRLEQRVYLEQIETVFPGLLAGLAAHEGIGWLMVNSADGPVVIGQNGRYYLTPDRIEGQNPLAGFGPNARHHLLRYNEFPGAPDIYVNSFYNAETNEVAAFEELIGCHGGMGGYQTRPFVLYPAELEITEPDLVGAATLYRQFKYWLHLYGGPEKI